MKNIGFDLVEISRFRKYNKRLKNSTKKPPTDAFLKKVFTEEELVYCYTYKDAATHLAGIFAAKEAVSKALSIASHPFTDIEILHETDGGPVAYRRSREKHGKQNRKLSVNISITHTRNTAGAIAIC